MLTNLRSELLGDFLTGEEKREKNGYKGKVMKFQGGIYCPRDDYDLAKIPALAGNGWQLSTLWQAVSLCQKFLPGGEFKTAIPLFTRYNDGKEVMTFRFGENEKWLFEFHPAELSGKFSKELRVLLVKPCQ